MAEIVSIPELRARCFALMGEMRKWDIVPYRRERKRWEKQIRDSFSYDELTQLHDRFEYLVSRAVMNKLSENL